MTFIQAHFSPMTLPVRLTALGAAIQTGKYPRGWRRPGIVKPAEKRPLMRNVVGIIP
jgi:hypothetical protein